MRRIVLVVLATVSLAAIAAPAASARHTLAHRVSALESKVSALQRKVNNLHRFTHSCLAQDWIPIGWYGDFTAPFGEFGYEWRQPDGVTTIYTTALDVAPNAEETAFYVATVNPSCLGQVAARATSLRMRLGALESGLRDSG